MLHYGLLFLTRWYLLHPERRQVGIEDLHDAGIIGKSHSCFSVFVCTPVVGRRAQPRRDYIV